MQYANRSPWSCSNEAPAASDEDMNDEIKEVVDHLREEQTGLTKSS